MIYAAETLQKVEYPAIFEDRLVFAAELRNPEDWPGDQSRLRKTNAGVSGRFPFSSNSLEIDLDLDDVVACCVDEYRPDVYDCISCETLLKTRDEVWLVATRLVASHTCSVDIGVSAEVLPPVDRLLHWLEARGVLRCKQWPTLLTLHPSLECVVEKAVEARIFPSNGVHPSHDQTELGDGKPSKPVSAKQEREESEVPVAEHGSVKLFPFGHQPVAMIGSEPVCEKLTEPQHNVLKALLDAGTEGLSLKQLNTESKRQDARKILKRLADKNPPWEKVIDFAGKAGRGYRIR